MTAPEQTGLVIVVSAPSGAGKTSILDMLFAKRPGLRFSVSVTTRAPRPGEVDGVDYRFVDDEAFDRHIAEDAFVEWAEVHGNRYGTLKQTIAEAVSDDTDIVLDTDTVGASGIRDAFPDAVLIFVAPPSPVELRDRLTRRNTESPDSFRERQDAVPREMSRMTEYDYVIINKTIETAVARFEAIIDAEHQRSARVLPCLTAWRDSIHGYKTG